MENGRITRVGAATHKPTIDLSGLTMMPGWIDTHVHLGWYFNKEGRLETGPGRSGKTTPQQAALFTGANARATLMGGFTTVQCLGIGDRGRHPLYNRERRAGRAARADQPAHHR